LEQDLTSLAAAVAELKAGIAATNGTFAETFYYLTIPLMVLIHVGFLAYEMGASRSKNALASGIKNILAFAMIVPFFYFIGWWIYWAFPTGLTLSEGAMGISGLAYANSIALPWSEYMGPNLDDRSSGVFWGAFVLFAATTASIMSGGVIERIKLTGFVVLAIILGSFVWILAGAWGWHADGWLVTKFGYHDFGAAGVVHMIAGFFTLSAC
jgi:ammonia channel protein AmtB